MEALIFGGVFLKAPFGGLGALLAPAVKHKNEFRYSGYAYF
jgi:hypothetical protein